MGARIYACRTDVSDVGAFRRGVFQRLKSPHKKPRQEIVILSAAKDLLSFVPRSA